MVIRLLIILEVILNLQLLAQDQEYNWVDDIKLVVIPKIGYTISTAYLEDLQSKFITLAGSKFLNRDKFELNNRVPITPLSDGSISVGLKYNNYNIYLDYLISFNNLRDNAYDSPYYSANGEEIGSSKFIYRLFEIKGIYYFLENVGLGLKYQTLSKEIDVVNILDNTNGLLMQNIASAHWDNKLLFLVLPVNYPFYGFGSSFSIGFSVLSSGENYSLINDSDTQFKKDYNPPFVLFINAGISKIIFNSLELGVKYKFNYETSKGNYSLLSNSIFISLGIPEL